MLKIYAYWHRKIYVRIYTNTEKCILYNLTFVEQNTYTHIYIYIEWCQFWLAVIILYAALFACL